MSGTIPATPLPAHGAGPMGKIPTSGSDFHDPTSVIDAGIQTDVPITDMKQLCAVLRSGKYTIHCGGALAQREHLTDFPAADL